MSFICQCCHKPQPSKTQPVCTVIQTVIFDHPRRFRTASNGYDKVLVDYGGSGTQIVREADLCEPCSYSDKVNVDGRWYRNQGSTSIRTETEPPVTRKRHHVAVDPTAETFTLYIKVVENSVVS